MVMSLAKMISWRWINGDVNECDEDDSLEMIVGDGDEFGEMITWRWTGGDGDEFDEDDKS